MGNLKNPVLFYIVLAALLLILFGITEVLFVHVNHYYVISHNIPEQLLSKKLIFISDLHCTHFFGRKNRYLIKMIRKQKPDCIIICGDLVNGSGKKRNIRYAESVLSGLASLNVPIIYTYGNHELKLEKNAPSVFAETERIANKYTKVLNNHGDTIILPGDSTPCLQVYGLKTKLEYYHGNTRSQMQRVSPGNAFKCLNENYYNILIAHDPTYTESYFETGADLILCGHLHGGIVRLPFIGGIISPRYTLFPNYSKGLYKKGHQRMIVSSGLGWHGIPFRLFNDPEIVSITFGKKTRR